VVVANEYDGQASAWDSGAGVVYRPLAQALVASSPIPLAARLVLDVGSGTGAVAQAAEAVGARVVTSDRSCDMVAFQTGRWPAVAADIVTLPFRDGGFDAALAGFVLNHLAPAAALSEMIRVVRPGGVVLASTWAGGKTDPVKAAIDAVLARWGWVPPDWYRVMKSDILPISGDPARMASAAEEAGLVNVTAKAGPEDLDVRDPRSVIAYRLAMPHVAPWAAMLDVAARAQLTRDALAAVTPHVDGWRPSMIVLAGRVAAQPNR
jgi:ubiquinone/menaquinone biosynthesis C-methylase UbiE